MEKLDYLWNLCKVQVLSNVTRCYQQWHWLEPNAKQVKTVRKDQEGKMSVASTLKTIPVSGLSLRCSSSAPAVNVIKTKAVKTNQQPPLLLKWPDFFTLTSYGDHLEYTNKDQTFCFTEVSDTFINNHLCNRKFNWETNYDKPCERSRINPGTFSFYITNSICYKAFLLTDLQHHPQCSTTQRYSFGSSGCRPPHPVKKC